MSDVNAQPKKTCPKCGLSMTAVDYVVGRGGLTIVLGFFSYVSMQLHACTGCGFVEFWVAKNEDLQKMREKLSRK